VLPRTVLAARYLPAERGVEVGGDWYDVIELPDARVLLAIGDVVGHGVKAAAVMGQLKSALRAYALEGHGPAATLDRLKAMVRSTTGGGMIGTLLVAVFDPQTATLRYASAGHPPALVRSAGGVVGYLPDGRTTPLAVGVQPAREAETVLEDGSLLLLYTDGLIERRTEGLGAGLDRLERAVEDGPQELDELLDHLLSELRGEAPSSDDTALLAMGPVRERAARMRIELPADRGSVTSARRAVGRWLIDTGASDEERYELTVALSDACANAVEHAYGPGDATFAIGAELVDGEVVIEVRDGGRWRSPRGVNRGRGLQLMNAFTDSLEIDKSESGTHVRMRRKLARGGE
jgi:anti-sigma regulatory factor (Ser/Thr protein kinase)